MNWKPRHESIHNAEGYAELDKILSRFMMYHNFKPEEMTIIYKMLNCFYYMGYVPESDIE